MLVNKSFKDALKQEREDLKNIFKKPDEEDQAPKDLKEGEKPAPEASTDTKEPEKPAEETPVATGGSASDASPTPAAQEVAPEVKDEANTPAAT